MTPNITFAANLVLNPDRHLLKAIWRNPCLARLSTKFIESSKEKTNYDTQQESQIQRESRKLLKVALVGAPNAGKSTLLNRLVDAYVSGASKKVHTTRRNVMGYYTRGDTQLKFYDSPGVVTRGHVIKHRLEDSLFFDPKLACSESDLIGVIIDASNIREQKRLNRGILEMLHEHRNTKSILIMNKVDAVKDKRMLLDIGTRLTEGSLLGERVVTRKQIFELTDDRLKELNLNRHHAELSGNELNSGDKERKIHKYVTILNKETPKKLLTASRRNLVPEGAISWNGFSSIFSISALKDENVEKLRDYMLDLALPVGEWPRGPDFLSEASVKNVVYEVIRSKFLDHVDGAIPYTLRYKFHQCHFDENFNLLVNLNVRCSDRYMVGKILGEYGANINRIIEQSREILEKTFACDVNLRIEVSPPSPIK